MTHLLANTLIVSWKLNIQPTNYELHSTPRYLVKVTKEYSWPFLTMSSSSISSVQFSCSVMSEHTRPPCPWPTPRAYSNSYLLSQWCHPTISSSVVPFSSHLQSFPASGSFQMSQFFASGGQSIRVSASKSVLPTNIQDWFPLGWTGWISLQSKGLSNVSSNTTVQKYQFFSTRLSLWFYIYYLMYVGSYIHCVEGDFRIHCLILTATLR